MNKEQMQVVAELYAENYKLETQNKLLDKKLHELQQENNQLKEQRQELRSWLEDEIKEIDRHTTTLDIFNTYDYETIHEMETKKITYKNVLSKLNELEG